MNAQRNITGTEAPLAYQAEVLRGQICDDLNSRFWRIRKRLFARFEERKDAIDRDYNRLSAAAFLEKYS